MENQKEEIRNRKPLEEVISALDNCLWNDGNMMCPECPYHGTENGQCGWRLMQDAQDYLEEYQERKNNFQDAEKRHFEASDILEKRIHRLSWHDRFKKQPEKEGEYLTFCHYRNGSTAYKIKLWHDYRFTSENDNVFFWIDLPENPESHHEQE